MLRAHELAERRPYGMLAAVALVTLFFGFVTQAAGSAYLLWIGDPIAAQYRTTLSYTSALIGDGILVPLVNVLVVSQLWIWARRPSRREVVGALVAGAALTAAVHLYQAQNAYLNWTMLAPYQWTPLGYVHAAFMFAELSFLLFFWGQVIRIGVERPRAVLSHRVVIATLCCLAFLRLLLGDYGYIG